MIDLARKMRIKETTKKMAEGTSNAGGVKVLLKTSMGDVTLQLYEDTPITSGNFQKLVEKGFYDGVIFHRIIDGFMIQGGDPTGTGCGGPAMSSRTSSTARTRTIAAPSAWPTPGPTRAEASSSSIW